MVGIIKIILEYSYHIFPEKLSFNPIPKYISIGAACWKAWTIDDKQSATDKFVGGGGG